MSDQRAEKEREIYYIVDDVDPSEKVRFRTSLPTDFDFDREAIAEAVARDYAYEGGGSVEGWPVEIRIYEANGEFIGHYRADREMFLGFRATEIGED
jgi:hypothetical protein